MNRQAPLISVIMPLHNAEKFVSQSIESVLGQTVGDFELIIVDDASTDTSAAVARSYADKDNRISLIQNESNLGAAHTRNRGMDAASGEFIAFIDSDDFYQPEHFAQHLAFFEQHPQVDLCGGYCMKVRSDGTPESIIKFPLTHKTIVYTLLFGNPFGVPAVMIRRGQLDQTGIRFKKCMAEDYQFWVDLSDKLQMANLPESLFFYRQWENQISTSQLEQQTHSAQFVQQELILRKYGIHLSEEEAQIYTRCSLSKGVATYNDLGTYRTILKRLYRADALLVTHDTNLFRKLLLLRYKKACQRFYPAWGVWFRKRLFLLELLRHNILVICRKLSTFVGFTDTTGK